MKDQVLILLCHTLWMGAIVKREIFCSYAFVCFQTHYSYMIKVNMFYYLMDHG